MKNSSKLSVVSLIIKVISAYQNQTRDFSIFTQEEKRHIHIAWALFASTFEFKFVEFRARYADLVDILLDDINAALFDLMMDIDENPDASNQVVLCQRGMYLSMKLFKTLSMSFVEKNEEDVKADFLKFYKHLGLVSQELEDYRWIYREIEALVIFDEYGKPCDVNMQDTQKYFSSIAQMIREHFISLEDLKRIAEINQPDDRYQLPSVA